MTSCKNRIADEAVAPKKKEQKKVMSLGDFLNDESTSSHMYHEI
jgi:hypothetical protein